MYRQKSWMYRQTRRNWSWELGKVYCVAARDMIQVWSPLFAPATQWNLTSKQIDVHFRDFLPEYLIRLKSGAEFLSAWGVPGEEALVQLSQIIAGDVAVSQSQLTSSAKNNVFDPVCLLFIFIKWKQRISDSYWQYISTHACCCIQRLRTAKRFSWFSPLNDIKRYEIICL